MTRLARNLAPVRILVTALAAAAVTWAQPAWAADPEAFRLQAPQAGAPKAVRTPQPQRFALANGLQVVLVERHDLPVVSLQLVMAGGSAADPADRTGQASACMALLSQGTQQLDKVHLAERLADLAASLESWASVDRQGLQLAVLSRHLDAALGLFADSLLQPAMRDDELGRWVARSKAAIEQAKANPSALATRLAPSVGWGVGHPWGRVTTAASLDRLTAAHCRSHAATLSPQGAWLYVAGDVTQAKLRALLDQRLGNWQAAPPPLPPAAPPQPRTGRLFVVPVRGAAQSVITVLQPGPRRDASDYEATALMTAILSGGFSSRINMNLREVHGWAYGAGGSFGYTRDGSVLSIQAAVRADATGPAVVEIFGEITAVMAEAVRPTELQREQQGAILALPARWSTARSVLQTFEGLRYFGLPLDWYDGFVARTAAVDAAAVLAAARQHLRPQTAQVLLVGDPDQLAPHLRALTAATGPLAGQSAVVLDSDGAEVKP
jgi:zinc protease